jgi:hypothetical protein
MARKMLGVFTAVAAALLLVGVAWAGTDGSGEQQSATDSTVSTVPEGDTTSSTIDDDETTTSTSIPGDTTSSTIDDDDTTTSTSIPGDTTSSTIDDDETTTSTSIPGDTTSSTIDDDDDETFEDQSVVYDIPGVGSITVEVVDGRLELVKVAAPGWDIEIKRAEADRVEVEFHRGSDEVDFEARLKHGKIKVEIEIEIESS